MSSIHQLLQYILSCSHWAITVGIGVMLWCVGLCSDGWHQTQGNPEDWAQIQQVFGHPCSTKSLLELGVVVAIPTLRRLRHKNHELMVSLDWLARPCLETKTSHAGPWKAWFLSTALQSTLLSPQVTECGTTAPLWKERMLCFQVS